MGTINLRTNAMKCFIFFLITLIVGCRSEEATIYVHHEGINDRTFYYRLNIDGEELLSDSLSYSNLVPNFSSYSTFMRGKKLTLQMDSLTSTLQYSDDIKFYSFFIFESDSTRSLRIIGTKYKKAPVFR